MNQDCHTSHFLLRCTDKQLDLRHGAVVMGIVNTTPDSFYDGGRLVQLGTTVDVDGALEQALAMVHEGASIIDVGGESSRPGAEKISVQEEVQRTVPLIAKLRQASDVLISIDTYKAEVAEAALRAGANMVNDISGFTFDPALPEICSRYKAAVILMHTPLTPQEMQWSTTTAPSKGNIVKQVNSFLRQAIERATAHGITDIIVDPGFGFGKSVEENFQLLQHLHCLQVLERPILCGVSRKSFLGQAITNAGSELVPPSQRLPATIAAGTIALLHGTNILRVHDVAAAVQSLRVTQAMANASSVA